LSRIKIGLGGAAMFAISFCTMEIRVERYTHRHCGLDKQFAQGVPVSVRLDTRRLVLTVIFNLDISIGFCLSEIGQNIGIRLACITHLRPLIIVTGIATSVGQ